MGAGAGSLADVAGDDSGVPGGRVYPDGWRNGGFSNPGNGFRASAGKRAELRADNSGFGNDVGDDFHDRPAGTSALSPACGQFGGFDSGLPRGNVSDWAATPRWSGKTFIFMPLDEFWAIDSGEEHGDLRLEGQGSAGRNWSRLCRRSHRRYSRRHDWGRR